jgi:hypothetical protein
MRAYHPSTSPMIRRLDREARRARAVGLASLLCFALALGVGVALVLL